LDYLAEGTARELRLLAKDEESGKAGCPSVYLAEDGSLVVQGLLLDSATEGNFCSTCYRARARSASSRGSFAPHSVKCEHRTSTHG
jgi:hypothetical protein